mmetsp:Transcript_2281/g.5627  ORF Transcript_2281/g.5627 Transcript_2281/m.5627 type:complete len:206 (-) Transcript_2281:52-669(-)
MPKRFCSLMSSTFMCRTSPGTTGLRNRQESTPPKKNCCFVPVPSPSSASSSSTSPPTCAIASTCSTPGMMGRCGKCPVKNCSFIETFFTATACDPLSISMTLSTRRNGYLCGKICWIAHASKTGVKFGPAFSIGSPASGAAATDVSVTEVDAAYTREAERETLLGVVERTLLGARELVLLEEDMDMDVFIIIVIIAKNECAFLIK